jgi:hypothetical protein
VLLVGGFAEARCFSIAAISTPLLFVLVDDGVDVVVVEVD